MKSYSIRYLEPAGHVTESIVEAPTEQEARLKIIGNHPSRIIIKVSKQVLLVPKLKHYLQPQIDHKDAMQFTSHLQSLSQAGVSIVDCLSIMENLVAKKTLKSLIRTLISKLNQGHSFSDALSESPKLYSPEFVALIRAGEKVGRLDDILKTLYNLLKWDHDLTTRVTKAFRYPTIVISVGTLSLFGVFTFIIPKFDVFFRNNKVDLPIITKILLAISNFMTEHFIPILAVLALLAYGIYLAKKSKTVAVYIDQVALKTPVFGTLYKYLIVSKSMKIFSILYSNGVSILESTKILKPLSSSAIFQHDLDMCHSKIKQGMSTGKAAGLTTFFNGLASQMITIGESSGNLGSMLDKTSQLYRDMVDQMLDRLFTYIEPLLIGIIGVLVLALALGIFSPMVNMMSIVGNG